MTTYSTVKIKKKHNLIFKDCENKNKISVSTKIEHCYIYILFVEKKRYS